jgi:hypothetical protein
MRTSRAVAALALTVSLVASLAARAEDDPAATAASKLGDAYAKAGPVDRMVQLAVARQDKTLDYKESAAAATAVVVGEIAKGKTPEERLRVLGKFRAEVTAQMKTLNDARTKEKKPYVGMIDADSDIQNACALAYIADVAGGAPTLEALAAPLALVRECTEWSAHTELLKAVAGDALNRDEAYRKADAAGKLDIIAKMSDGKMISDFERTALEKPVLEPWIRSELKAGKTAAELVEKVKLLNKNNRICFFTSSWMTGILGRIDPVGGLKK